MEKVDYYAKIIWDYMLMHQKLEKADIILCFGSNDVRTADWAVDIYKRKFAPIIVCSGGNGKDSAYLEPEAVVFSKRMIELGIPAEAIILEPNATNTGENILFTKELLQKKNIQVKKLILVQKPYMERRAFSAMRKQWPEVECIVTSPEISYEEYPNGRKPEFKKRYTDVMVGDLLRIKEYPKLGFQIEQEIPNDVWQAGQELVKLGYDKYAYLLK